MLTRIINGRESNALAHGLFGFHGNSVFTTIRTRNKKPLLWSRHWQRLTHDAKFFDFFVPSEEKILQMIIGELRNLQEDQKIRIILSEDNFALTFDPLPFIEESVYEGVDVIFSSINVHPQLKVFKTSNSLPYSLGAKEAKKNNAFEALLCDQNGHVVVAGAGLRRLHLRLGDHRLVLAGRDRLEVGGRFDLVGVKTS